MKLEEIRNKTNEAVSYLVAALDSRQSDVNGDRERLVKFVETPKP